MTTTIGLQGRQICINDRPVYSDIPEAKKEVHGLLMNQRMIQGVFDDRKDRSRFNLFGRVFDPDENTDRLIASLPAWHDHGLRAITVGFQGGWPVGCVDVTDIDNNPFGQDGLKLDPAYAQRMDRIIRAADDLGMIVIVSLLYWSQSRQLRDGLAVENAVKAGAEFCRDGGYTNVIIEVANEYNIDGFKDHPLIYHAEGMAHLIRLARRASGGMLVGSSGGGGMADEQVVRASDVVLVHGNGLTSGQYYDFLRKVRSFAQDKPIVCNEDSPCHTRLDVAMATQTSWGYYNNYTKQIPPADYGITTGEDRFFARRMARCIGLDVPSLPESEQYILQGLEPDNEFFGQRVIRLAAEFPERVSQVDFFHQGTLVYSSFDEPYFCFGDNTWLAHPWKVTSSPDAWHAIVHRVGEPPLEVRPQA